MREGMGVHRRLLAEHHLVKANMTDDRARSGDVEMVERQERVGREDEVDQAARPVKQMLDRIKSRLDHGVGLTELWCTE